MKIKNLFYDLGRLLEKLYTSALENYQEQSAYLNNLTIQHEIARRQKEHPNPLAGFGKFGFSQADEDGITIEILSRLNIQQHIFCEFGVGDGTENNTLILLAKGWRGTWYGGEKLAFELIKSKRLSFKRVWVTRENIYELYKQSFSEDGDPNVVSIDLDGNDLYCVEELLEKGAKPSLFIVEYNAKFPPPIEFCVTYDANFQWDYSDYFGASLISFCNLFKRFGYQLICCNAATGSNAFFIREENMDKFPDVPKTIEQIYSAPYYYPQFQIGHPTSAKTIEQIIR